MGSSLISLSSLSLNRPLNHRGGALYPVGVPRRGKGAIEALAYRENMLDLVFILPLAGIIYLIIIPRDNSVRLKKTALEWSLLTLMATILLWGSFDGEGQFQAAIKLE